MKSWSGILFLFFSMALWPFPGESASNETLQKILDLDDTALYHGDINLFTDLESRILDTGTFGIAINAPETIDLSASQTIPLVMALHTSGERGWKYPLKDHCILVVTRRDTGEVLFANPFPKKKGKRPKAGPPKPESSPEGLPETAASVIRLNPVKHLDLPLSPGQWRLGVLYHDWVSNMVDITIAGENSQTLSPTILRP